jgi:hypothetical protein
MYDHADHDTHEPDTRNDAGHSGTCSCPECRPDLAVDLPAAVSSTLDRAGIRHTVEITGPSVLVTLRGPIDLALAWAALEGYDVVGDGPTALRVSTAGTVIDMAVEARREGGWIEVAA